MSTLIRIVVPALDRMASQVGPSPDKMLLARLFSYADAHRARMGVNYKQIPVNQPKVPARRTKSLDADANKKVLDSVKEVLDIIAKTEMALASGHLHVSETWVVFEEAQRRGVKRLIFTHPEDIVDASLNDVRGVAAMGAMVEHSLAFFLEGSKFKTRSAEDMRKQIEAAGVESTILCSDLGQVGVFSPLEGFRRAVELCFDLGYRDEDIHKMVSSNAARVLGLETLVSS